MTETIIVKPRIRPVVVIDGVPTGPRGPQGPMGPPLSPNTPGAMALRTPGLDGWFAKVAQIRSRRLRAVWLGDSISVLSNIGGFAAPWMVAEQLARWASAASPEKLGTRYTDPAGAGAVPVVEAASGVSSYDGAGGYSSVMASGDECAVTGTIRTIRVVYTGDTDAGVIEIYDGPSSGAVVASVDASNASGHSQIFEHTFAARTSRTVTIKIDGGSGTLIEQLVPLADQVADDAGVDMVVCAHSGFHTGHFVPTGDPYAIDTHGDPSSHALAFIEEFQPDIVVNALGYNDATVDEYEHAQAALLDGIFAAAPGTSVLTVVPYMGAGNTLSDQYQPIAEQLAADHSGKVAVTSYYATMGDVSDANDLPGYSWDGAHPTGLGKAVQAMLVTAAITGDPLGAALSAPTHAASNPEINWIGKLVGTVVGTVAPSTVTVTGSRDLARTDYGALLIYTGASDITLTIDTSELVGALGGVDSRETRIVQGGSGKITIAGDGTPVLVGTTATTAQGDVLTVTAAGALATTIVCTLAS